MIFGLLRVAVYLIRKISCQLPHVRYLEQFHQPTIHHIKTWVLCSLSGGELSVAAPEATREHIVEAKFFSRFDVDSESRPIFPELISKDFWQDLSQGFPEFKYIGMREMEFY